MNLSPNYIFLIGGGFPSIKQCPKFISFLCTPPGRRLGTAVGGEWARPGGGIVFLYYLRICPYQVRKKTLLNKTLVTKANFS